MKIGKTMKKMFLNTKSRTFFQSKDKREVESLKSNSSSILLFRGPRKVKILILRLPMYYKN